MRYKNHLNTNLITILGPTATGKTKVAAQLCAKWKGEIISADSRQVYKDMNIGTGKDYNDYVVNETKIPYHLIDVVEAGSEYNVYQFQQDFLNAYWDIKERGKNPVLCGGTGMYIEAILQCYQLVNVAINNTLRKELEQKDIKELASILSSFRKLHHSTRSLERKKIIRSIEIATYYKEHPETESTLPEIKSVIFGIQYDRKIIRERITLRLKERLKNGMIEEVQSLLHREVSAEKLQYYGLEYKWITQYLLGMWTYDEMFQGLNTAIHQFAKRQMTWFRKMERNGFVIHWISGECTIDQKVEQIIKQIS